MQKAYYMGLSGYIIPSLLSLTLSPTRKASHTFLKLAPQSRHVCVSVAFRYLLPTAYDRSLLATETTCRPLDLCWILKGIISRQMSGAIKSDPRTTYNFPRVWRAIVKAEVLQYIKTQRVLLLCVGSADLAVWRCKSLSTPSILYSLVTHTLYIYPRKKYSTNTCSLGSSDLKFI
jgi:hypothetical protein